MVAHDMLVLMLALGATTAVWSLILIHNDCDVQVDAGDVAGAGGCADAGYAAAAGT